MPPKETRRRPKPARQRSRDAALIGAQLAMARHPPLPSAPDIAAAALLDGKLSPSSPDPDASSLSKPEHAITSRKLSRSQPSQKALEFRTPTHGQDRDKPPTLSAIQQTVILLLLLLILWIIHAHLTLLVSAFLGAGILYTGLSYYLVKSQREITLKALDISVRQEVEG